MAQKRTEMKRAAIVAISEMEPADKASLIAGLSSGKVQIGGVTLPKAAGRMVRSIMLACVTVPIGDESDDESDNG
jgi:hypothetical protein